MKLKDISSLYLSQKTIDDIDVDITDLISHDEFGKKTQGKHGYRREAIERLRKNKLPFHTTCNLAYEIIKSFISVQCPYCDEKMESEGGGGSSDHSSVDFRCPKCKATSQLTVDNSNGLYFQPKED